MARYDPADDADKMRALVQLAASVGSQLANVARSLAIEADQLAQPHAVQNVSTIAALVRRSAQRVETIANDLLTFAGQAPARQRTISFADAWLDIQGLLHRLAGKSVNLAIGHSRSALAIVANLQQLEQIMCTLVARACDAGANDITITIRPANAAQPVESRFAGHVLIEVADTGPCIPPQHLRQIFEPKLARKSFGLWLGLATVYGAVRQMGGDVIVESDVHGSKFSLFVPCHTD